MSQPASGEAMGWFQRLLDAISLACRVFTGVALVSLTLMFGWLVWGRYVLNATPTWVEQVSLLIIVTITFLGAAVGIHENTHLGVSYFRELSPAPVRKVFTAISHVMLAGFGLVMMVAGWQLTLFKWGTQIPLIHLPEGLRSLPAAVGGGLIFLFSVGHLLLMARGVEEEQDLIE